jgi:hypothetical protein
VNEFMGYFDKLPKPLRYVAAFASIGAAFYVADYMFTKFSEHM